MTMIRTGTPVIIVTGENKGSTGVVLRGRECRANKPYMKGILYNVHIDGSYAPSVKIWNTDLSTYIGAQKC